jgi:hypothetical protein
LASSAAYRSDSPFLFLPCLVGRLLRMLLRLSLTLL